MNFAGFVERHTRSILLVAIAGAISATALPVGLFPQVSFPRVVVDLDAGTRPADQTALLVTRPVEQAVRAVPGVPDVRSGSTRGKEKISIDFGWGRDMTSSPLRIDAAIQQVLPSLPAETSYGVRRMDPTVFPIISYALTTTTLSPVALRDLAQFQIVPLLSAIPGLVHVDVQGGDTAEVQVLADPQRLAAYGLGLADLSAALTAGNVLSSGGRVQDHGKLFLVLSNRSLGSSGDVGRVVLRSDPAGIVRVQDVATVTDGVVPQYVGVEED